MILGEQYNHDGKKYIDVTAIFRSDGRLEPISILWEDGRTFPVDNIVDVRRAASLRAGGCGVRYICEIRGKRVIIFLEKKIAGSWKCRRTDQKPDMKKDA